jgi:pimeloyl-ACP methyl ester carboxylesterase
MQLISETVADDVRQSSFFVGDITGVIWSPCYLDAPPTGTQRVILIGHGGGQNKQAPGVVARAKRFTSCGFTLVAIDAPGHGERPKTEDDERSMTAIRQTMESGEPVEPLINAYNALLTKRAVPEWKAVLDDLLALDGYNPAAPVGYWGVALGCAIGVALVAAEPRIVAAVVSLIGDEASQAIAAQVTIPVQMMLQWDDELVSREAGLAVFDAFASTEKSLHANSGRHLDLPRFEVESAERFFMRHLVGNRAGAS